MALLQWPCCNGLKGIVSNFPVDKLAYLTPGHAIDWLWIIWSRDEHAYPPVQPDSKLLVRHVPTILPKGKLQYLLSSVKVPHNEGDQQLKLQLIL